MLLRLVFLSAIVLTVGAAFFYVPPAVGYNPNAKKTDDLTSNSALVPRFASDDPHLIAFTNVDTALLDPGVLDAFLQDRSVGWYQVVQIDSHRLRDNVRAFPHLDEFPISLGEFGELVVNVLIADEDSLGFPTGIASLGGKIVGSVPSSIHMIVATDQTVKGAVYLAGTGRIAIEPIPNSNLHALWQYPPGYSRKVD
ncbi:MAG: hypothetical protein AAGH76_14475 [Pseudomonadota bacterium]